MHILSHALFLYELGKDQIKLFEIIAKKNVKAAKNYDNSRSMRQIATIKFVVKSPSATGYLKTLKQITFFSIPMSVGIRQKK